MWLIVPLQDFKFPLYQFNKGSGFCVEDILDLFIALFQLVFLIIDGNQQFFNSVLSALLRTCNKSIEESFGAKSSNVALCSWSSTIEVNQPNKQHIFTQ
jgi:hypothetical protein